MRIYYGDLKDSKNLESSSFFQLNSCGSSVTTDTEHLVVRSGRTDYHILYITEGEAEIYAEDGSFVTLSKGDFVLYPPKTPQKYKRLKGSRDFWIHFNGFQVPEILNDTALYTGICRAEKDESAVTLFNALITERSLVIDSKREKGILLTLLYTLGGLISGKSLPSHSTAVRMAVEYINENYEKSYSNGFLAKKCNLSLSRFEHLFHAETGLSAGAYRQRLRIENAKSLLTSTELSVLEISALNGFTDQLYFSRLFKRKTGLSPTEYRRTQTK